MFPFSRYKTFYVTRNTRPQRFGTSDKWAPERCCALTIAPALLNPVVFDRFREIMLAWTRNRLLLLAKKTTRERFHVHTIFLQILEHITWLTASLTCQLWLKTSTAAWQEGRSLNLRVSWKLLHEIWEGWRSLRVEVLTNQLSGGLYRYGHSAENSRFTERFWPVCFSDLKKRNRQDHFYRHFYCDWWIA